MNQMSGNRNEIDDSCGAVRVFLTGSDEICDEIDFSFLWTANESAVPLSRQSRFLNYAVTTRFSNCAATARFSNCAATAIFWAILKVTDRDGLPFRLHRLVLPSRISASIKKARFTIERE